MSDESTTRQSRKARPSLEGLEDRQLLNAQMNRHGKWENLIIHDKDLSRFVIQKNNPVAVEDRRMSYVTPEGSRVTITLYGKGNLRGSTVDDDGALNLRFIGTDSKSGIVGMVHGGTGRAPVRSVLHAGLPPDSVSGIGSNVIRVVNLKSFDLVDGGRVNLTGGVKSFFLNSTGQDTQVSLRELPEELLTSDTANSATRNGVTFGFALDLAGAQTLTSTTGSFIPGAQTFPGAPSASAERDVPTPPGLVAVINQVNGPSRAEQGLGDPQFFGYDAVDNALIGFAVSQTETGLVAHEAIRIPNALPGGSPVGFEPGVSLSRNNGDLVALLSDGTNVYAYDPLDGSSVGQFSLINTGTTNPINLTGWTRLGTVDSFTVVGEAGTSDPATGEPVTAGKLRFINVTNSLATGEVQPLGSAFAASPFIPGREFGLSGGFGSVAGSSTLFAAGGAHFDTFLPNEFQLGALSLRPSATTLPASSVSLTESARNRLNGAPNSSNTNSTGAFPRVDPTQPREALGSLDLFLALITNFDADAGTSEVSLYNPQSFSRSATVTLHNPNPLTALTSAFYPDLDGVALIDVQGNVQSFRSNSTQGMVLNDLGTLNFLKIHRATDSTVIGYPISHVEVAIRDNVALISTSRPENVGPRGGVTVEKDRRPTGPLSLP
ncbi:MAG: hypothetical protein AB7I30_02935 [Isosphaeraceae bacterium]